MPNPASRTPPSPPVELHRPLAVARVDAEGMEIEVTAQPGECAALAKRMRLPRLDALCCRFRLSALGGGVLLAQGHLLARALRVCVVTLEEFEAVTEEHFRLRFVPAGQESENDDPETDDEIPYCDGEIDLGEAAAEQLALALDPYPRRPGASLPEAAGTAAEHPFAALAERARRR